MTSCVHKMCERTYGQTNMKRAITLAKINHPWNRYNMCMLRPLPPLAEWWVYWNTLVRPSVRPSLNLVYVTSHLSFVGFYSYLVSWLAMIGTVNVKYTVIELNLYLMVHSIVLMFEKIWLSHTLNIIQKPIIHIWYHGWPWSEHAHIIPILRMVDFCESYSPFHVCLTIRPSAHLVYVKRCVSSQGSWLVNVWNDEKWCITDY
jgi:hypothetical protein